MIVIYSMILNIILLTQDLHKVKYFKSGKFVRKRVNAVGVILIARVAGITDFSFRAEPPGLWIRRGKRERIERNGRVCKQ